MVCVCVHPIIIITTFFVLFSFLYFLPIASYPSAHAYIDAQHALSFPLLHRTTGSTKIDWQGQITKDFGSGSRGMVQNTKNKKTEEQHRNTHSEKGRKTRIARESEIEREKREKGKPIFLGCTHTCFNSHPLLG